MKIKQWLVNARQVALAQSVMPAVLAVSMAAGESGFHWYSALLAVLGVACAHLAMNLADDYFDYKVDMLGDRDKVIRQGFRAMSRKYPYLTSGEEDLNSTARAISCFIIVALCCGAVIVADRFISGVHFLGENGLWWIFAIVAACAFLGVFYSAPPLKLAYRGFGELIIGFIFGPLLMMGVYYACCARVDASIVMVSVLVGLLVLNILFTHSFIEKEGDKASNKMTFARLLGSDKLNLLASALFIFLPFVLIVLAVVLKWLHPLNLLSLLVLPRGIWLFGTLVDFSRGKRIDIEKVPVWIGPVPEWNEVRSKKLDWFLGRWLCARNLLSGFCVLLMLAAIVCKFI